MLRAILNNELENDKEAIKKFVAAPSEFEIHVIRKMIEAQKSNFADYFLQTENERLGKNLVPGHVSHTVFWLIENEIIFLDISNETKIEILPLDAICKKEIIPGENASE